jgi:SAM-dependent methyltransferase
MAKCKICSHKIPALENIDLLCIKDVPESTFNFSDTTINLYIHNCNFCGAVYLSDNIVPLSVDYDVVYRSIGLSSLRETKKEQLKKFIKTYNLTDKTLVEIGCGDGQFLEIFRELKINIEGIEVGSGNYNRCLNKNLKVEHGDISRLKKNNYDAFFTFYYLEHLPYPIEFIKQLYSILRPGGIGLIEVPSYDCIEKNNVWLEFTKDHRFYFRKRTLQYLLCKCGFQIESIETDEDTLCLKAIVKKPNTTNFISMLNQIKNDVKDFKNLVDVYQGSFAIYGAGHYAQLLLNQVYAQYQIKPTRIFDSNVQKWGNKLCNICIEDKVAFENTNDYKAIIIICGIYNNEVSTMLTNIKTKLNKSVEIMTWK